MKHIKRSITLLLVALGAMCIACFVYSQQSKRTNPGYSQSELIKALNNHAEQMKILSENQKDFDRRLEALEVKVRNQVLTPQALQAHARLICDTIRDGNRELRNVLRRR